MAKDRNDMVTLSLSGMVQAGLRRVDAPPKAKPNPQRHLDRPSQDMRQISMNSRQIYEKCNQ
jgi:hypothetical protein